MKAFKKPSTFRDDINRLADIGKRLPLEDARSMRIQNDMRVGARVFRTGTPVSDVLAAATAAYSAHPVTPEAEDRQADDIRKTFVRRIHGILSNYAKDGPAAASAANEAFTTVLDAFTVNSVAQVDEADRAQFEKRLRELLP